VILPQTATISFKEGKELPAVRQRPQRTRRPTEKAKAATETAKPTSRRSEHSKTKPAKPTNQGTPPAIDDIGTDIPIETGAKISSVPPIVDPQRTDFTITTYVDAIKDGYKHDKQFSRAIELADSTSLYYVVGEN
jgi:hypothetical protein